MKRTVRTFAELHERNSLVWRISVLCEAGLGRREARAIASQPDLDVHQFASLIEQGSTVHQAMRLVANERLLA